MVNKKLENLEIDLVNIQGFISGEFIKLLGIHNGKADILHRDFKDSLQSLIFADPDSKENAGKPVLSFTATEKGIKEKAETLLKNGDITEEELNSLYKKIEDTKSSLVKKLSTNEGIAELVDSRIKSQLIAESITLFLEDPKTGEISGMKPDEKNKLVYSLKDHIKIPKSLRDSILARDTDCETSVIQIIKKQITDSLGKETKDGYYVLDKEKSEDKNLLSMIHDKVDRQLTTLLIINDSIKNFAKNSTREIEGAEKEEIRDSLLSKLEKLDKNYLNEKKHEISKHITKGLEEANKFPSFLMKFGFFRKIINYL
jgi:hypothetical protein